MTYDVLVAGSLEISRPSITCREDSFEMHVPAKTMSVPNNTFILFVCPSDHGGCAQDSPTVSLRWNDETNHGTMVVVS